MKCSLKQDALHGRHFSIESRRSQSSSTSTKISITSFRESLLQFRNERCLMIAIVILCSISPFSPLTYPLNVMLYKIKKFTNGNGPLFYLLATHLPHETFPYPVTNAFRFTQQSTISIMAFKALCQAFHFQNLQGCAK